MSRHPHRLHFPTFLLPSMPFRRRRTSSDSTASAASTLSSSPPTSPAAATAADPAPPAAGAEYLGRHASYLRCARCAVDLCLTSAIVSRGFTGRWRRRARRRRRCPTPTCTGRCRGSW
jgi:hypothetical protein